MPQELIDKFIDDLWFERDTGALKTLSQTSRLFLHRCRRHLFAHIRLSSANSPSRSQCIARKAKNLEEVLVREPDIANYVQILFLLFPIFDNAEVHIISQLLLRFSMISKFSLYAPAPHDWTFLSPELQAVISRLAYSPKMKTFSLYGIYNFPISFFASCTNITELSFQWCAFEDHLENAETGSIARLHTLDLCRTSAGADKLIYGRNQDGSPILDFSHLQELRISIPEHEIFPAFQEIFKRAPKLISLHLQGTQ
jgi:hypothetical protein